MELVSITLQLIWDETNLAKMATTINFFQLKDERIEFSEINHYKNCEKLLQNDDISRYLRLFNKVNEYFLPTMARSEGDFNSILI